MQITPTVLAPTPASPPAGGTAPAPAEPGAFAKMLSAQQPATTPPGKPARARADAAAPKPRPDGPGEPPPADASSRPAPSLAAADASLLAADEPEAAPRIEPDTEAATAPLAAEVLAALNLPAPPTSPPLPIAPPHAALPALPVPVDAAAPAGDAPATDLKAVAGAPAATRPRTAAPEPAPAEHAPREAMSPVVDTAAAAERVANLPPAVHAESAMPRNELRIELPPPLAAIAPQQRHEGAAAAPPVALAMPTPATAPEFREALGVQVSVLARDGVQHAELHLNPAEMGPISVQIALTGTQAQVDFGAESLATRQIIEAGLPELASALRDAGFTLAGGGVSQHPRGRSDGAPGDGTAGGSRRGQGGDAAEPAAPQRTTARLPMGAVDLYA